MWGCCCSLPKQLRCEAVLFYFIYFLRSLFILEREHAYATLDGVVGIEAEGERESQAHSMLTAEPDPTTVRSDLLWNQELNAQPSHPGAPKQSYFIIIFTSPTYYSWGFK